MKTLPHLIVLRLFMLFLFVCPASLCVAQEYYTVDQIPDPKKNGGGYVSDPDHVLNSSDFEVLNVRIRELEAKTKVQIAVVLVKDFDKEAEDFDFAQDLFRKWGIGQAGANNGLLLFVSVDRRAYRFITGYGLEGILPDGVLKRIGDHSLVPAFKEARYGDGIYAALNTVADYLGQPANAKELDKLIGTTEPPVKPWMAPIGYSLGLMLLSWIIYRSMKKHMPLIGFKTDKKNGYDHVVNAGCIGVFAFICIIIVWVVFFEGGLGRLEEFNIQTLPLVVYVFVSINLFFRYYGVLSSNRRFYKDDENFSRAVGKFNGIAWVYVIASPLLLFSIIREEIHRRNLVKRFKPRLDPRGEPMVRLNRDDNWEGKPYLSAGQLAEETAGVYLYDIWVSLDDKDHQIIANEGPAFDDFEDCPKCHQKTFCKPKTVTIRAATYSREGSAKKIRLCENCGLEELIKTIVLSKLTKSSSSSSSSGGSSSSSSSGSSWGGGSSGGGGAGGKW